MFWRRRREREGELESVRTQSREDEDETDLPGSSDDSRLEDESNSDGSLLARFGVGERNHLLDGFEGLEVGKVDLSVSETFGGFD